MAAPIALFVYDRLWHTQQTVSALQRNFLAEESDLIIFSDGAKSAEKQAGVNDVRRYVKSVGGFNSVEVVEREANLGLAGSIIDGVTRVCAQRGQVVVLEDDLVTSPYFLQYMNGALQRYARDERVISIHGYIYPVADSLPTTFFLRGADCWGWATWKRGWDLFEADAGELYSKLQLSEESHVFDFDGTSAYTGMLKQQIEGHVNSWAIRWYASAFLANKLTLYPGVSLVRNIGNDNSGTHSRQTEMFDVPLAQEPVALAEIPVQASAIAYAAVSRYFKSQKSSLLRRILGKLARWLRQRVAV
jgi:hypothetical protein